MTPERPVLDEIPAVERRPAKVGYVAHAATRLIPTHEVRSPRLLESSPLACRIRWLALALLSQPGGSRRARCNEIRRSPKRRHRGDLRAEYKIEEGDTRDVLGHQDLTQRKD